jgi:acetoin utilization protein AcuB
MSEKKLTVGDWMTPNPHTIDASASIIEAIHLLKEKEIRRLPVLKNGQLVGLVTEKMLLGYVPTKVTSLDQWEVHSLLAKTSVTAAMNPKPHTVRPETPLADVAALLHDRKLNGVIVVDAQGKMVGLLTTTNALEALIHFTRQTASS